MPWRNHVDFDELHPGEDQIAEESIPQPNFNPMLSFPFRPLAALPVPEMPAIPTEENPRRVVLPMPRFNTDPEREFAHPFLSMFIK